MWEDMKFKFDIWEKENNRMNQSINTISKFVLKNDAITTDMAIKTKLNTNNNILNSNKINEEVKNHLALNDYELINIKLDGDIIKAVPEVDVDRTSAEGKASSVQFIHFNLSDNQINKFKSCQQDVEIGIDHKEYSHITKLTNLTMKSLSADFN